MKDKPRKPIDGTGSEPLVIPPQSPLIDRDIIELVRRHQIIEPFDRKLLSGCSYDLRVGTNVRSRNRERKFDLSQGKGLYVEAGECVTLQTLEVLNFREPPLFGYVVNKHSVLARGLVHPITKVDPGFMGPLAVTIFNLGGPSEKLEVEQAIVSLIIYPLHAVPDRVYGDTQKPTSGREGSLDVATVVDIPPGPLDDAGLARMYGRPISRLYERMAELEKVIEQLRKGR